MKAEKIAGPSFRQLIDTKVLKRADAMKAQLDDLHEEPGFNWREEGEDLEKSIMDLARFIIAGGQIPDLEVRPRAEGGVWIVDGHRRARAIRKAAEEGFPLPQFRDKAGVVWVSIKAFEGDDADRLARVATSNDGRQLTQLERALGYLRMKTECGLGPVQIAAKVNKTRQHVDQLLILATAPEAIKQMVRDGRLSATEAMKLVRSHGDGAEEVAEEAVETAAAAGKKKATAKTIKAWSPSACLSKSLIETLDYVIGLLGSDIEKKIHAVAGSGEKPLDGRVLTVPANAVHQLVLMGWEVEKSRSEHRAKVKAQEAENAQQQLEEQNEAEE